MRRYLSAIGIGLALLSLSVPAVAKKHHHASANPASMPAAMSDQQLMVKAGPVDGSYAVHVFGHGPASTPIRLYVAVWISKDLPLIPLGTNSGYQNVVTDGDGNFRYQCISCQQLLGTQT